MIIMRCGETPLDALNRKQRRVDELETAACWEAIACHMELVRFGVHTAAAAIIAITAFRVTMLEIELHEGP